MTSNLIGYFKPNQTETSLQDAHFYALCVMFFTLFKCFYMHNYILWVVQFGIEMKTAFSSLLYRKALRLSSAALDEISIGNIVTLMTKDVYAFQQSIFALNDIWNGILQSIIICYILYYKIGAATFIGIGILLSAIPIQSKLEIIFSLIRIEVS